MATVNDQRFELWHDGASTPTLFDSKDEALAYARNRNFEAFEIVEENPEYGPLTVWTEFPEMKLV